MKKTLPFLALLLLAGCVSYSRDGDKVSAFGLFMQVGTIDATQGTNGLRTLRLEKLSPDAESIKSVAEGVAKGMTEGVK